MKNYIGANALCEKFGMNRRQLRKLTKRGLPFIRLGERSQLFNEDAVTAWLEAREVA